jgi:ribonuclease T2
VRENIVFIVVVLIVIIFGTINNNIGKKEELLALSWQNAFCETHRKVKECKRGFFAKTRYTDTAFGLHGLWPQPRSNIYCGVSAEDKKFDKNHQWNRLPKLNLSSSTIKELKKVMAGYDSNLHRHEWIKHGTCSNMSADKYYSRAISLTKQLNNSKVGKLFKNNIGKKITLNQVKFKMNQDFGANSTKQVELRCRNGLITELWIHLKGDSDNLKELFNNNKTISSKCKEGRVDRVGF